MSYLIRNKMNIKLTSEERKEFLKDMIEDEVKSIIRKEVDRMIHQHISDITEKRLQRLITNYNIEKHMNVVLDKFINKTAQKMFCSTDSDDSNITKNGYPMNGFDENSRFYIKKEFRTEIQDRYLEYLKNSVVCIDMDKLEEDLKEELLKKLVK